MPDFEFVTWDFVEESVEKMVERIRGFRKFSGVYGLPCGGLCLAVMLHHRLKIPMLNHAAKNSVIVDDIADSGKSLCHFAEDKTSFITTLYYHKQSLVEPNLWLKEKTDRWVVFPWENQKDPE